jgi:hypothetical protein
MNHHKVNIAAGLIVASFVLTHTINHALGLWSLEAAEGARPLFGLLWRNPVASAALRHRYFGDRGARRRPRPDALPTP